MKNTKKLLMSLALIMAAGTASGCSRQVEIKVLHANPVSVADLRAKYSSSNPIEITFWSNFGASMTSYVETALDAFQDKYDFIKVTHEGKGGYEGLLNAMVKSLNSSSYPNVAVGYPDHFATYISSSIQYELDTFIESEEYGVDLSDYRADYLRENQSLFYKDGANKTQPWTVGLPYNKSTEVMVYNKSLFTALGLEAPKTWAEVETVGAAIIAEFDGHFGSPYTIEYEDAEGQPQSYTIDLTGVTKEEFYPLSWDAQANFFITMAYQFGGEYTEMGDTLESGYIKFNNPEVLSALAYIQDLGRTKHILGIPSTWNETSYCSAPFKANKSVMTISSSAGVTNNIPSGNKFEVGISSIPYKDEEHKYVISQGANLGIFKSDDDHATASWLLIRYLTGGEYTTDENANVDFCISSGYLPVTISGESSDWYQQYIHSVGTPADQAKISVQKIANETYVNENWHKFVDPAFIGSATIRQEVEKITQFILTGASGKIYTPQEAIDFVYKRLSRYVEK